MPDLQKRSITLDKHRTSLALEPEFWAALEAAAEARKLSLTGLLADIDRNRGDRALASACRILRSTKAGGALADM